MPYPQDPFALKMKTPYVCPSCKKRTLIQETKDQQSPFMGQCRCEQCGYVTSAEAAREALRESRSK
jgi:hypothetical protein